MSKLEIPDTTIAEYVGLLDGFLTEESYTAYGISTVLNKVLVADGREKVQSQRMYNYARNGLIVKGEKITGVTLREFTKAEVAMFIIRYCLRNGVKIAQTDTNPDQLELDLEMDTPEETSN
jgi:hypothetical protein